MLSIKATRIIFKERERDREGEKKKESLAEYTTNAFSTFRPERERGDNSTTKCIIIKTIKTV